MYLIFKTPLDHFGVFSAPYFSSIRLPCSLPITGHSNPGPVFERGSLKGEKVAKEMIQILGPKNPTKWAGSSTASTQRNRVIRSQAHTSHDTLKM
jgi:hypothetical protein